MTDMTRAERRRAARETVWFGHDADQHQTLDPWRRLAIHTQDCRRCSDGSVETRGCAWLERFYQQNAKLVAEELGFDTHDVDPDDIEEMDEEE